MLCESSVTLMNVSVTDPFFLSLEGDPHSEPQLEMKRAYQG